MSPSPAATRAIEWLEAQLEELSGIRNATARDPSFKNWRQNTLTVMQRIWPGDQARSERFRRIPFSPANPNADGRTVREWYSRGCQEAARVLNGFVEEIRAQGVPELPQGEPVAQPAGNDFEDGFPTVDLPAGDLGASAPTAAEDADALPQGMDPTSPEPPKLQVAVAAAPEPEPSAPAEPPETLEPVLVMPPPVVTAAPAAPPKKGRNMKSRLRDLLGFAQLSAKALAGFPPELDAPAETPPEDPASDPVSAAAPPPAPPVASPAEPVAPQRAWPLPGSAPSPAPSASAWPAPPAAEAAGTETGAPRAPGRPTGLRTNIGKVSIESLISPEFRTSEPAAAESAPGSRASARAAESAARAPEPPAPPAPKPRPETPRPPARTEKPLARHKPEPVVEPPAPARTLTPRDAAPTDSNDWPATREPAPPAEERATTPARPFTDDPEFNMDPSPSAELVRPARRAPVAPEPTSKVVPLPTVPRTPVPEIAKSKPQPELEAQPEEARVDPEAFARATEDFMRSSPVLGASPRRGARTSETPGFGDPDAIAVASMVLDMTGMGVPNERQAEVRARLMDLARRLERDELEWSALRKAVWFAMEYPDLARRLMPVLLPWIDRAA